MPKNTRVMVGLTLLSVIIWGACHTIALFMIRNEITVLETRIESVERTLESRIENLEDEVEILRTENAKTMTWVVTTREKLVAAGWRLPPLQEDED